MNFAGKAVNPLHSNRRKVLQNGVPTLGRRQAQSRTRRNLARAIYRSLLALVNLLRKKELNNFTSRLAQTHATSEPVIRRCPPTRLDETKGRECVPASFGNFLAYCVVADFLRREVIELLAAFGRPAVALRSRDILLVGINHIFVEHRAHPRVTGAAQVYAVALRQTL